MQSHAINTLEFDKLKRELLALVRTPLGESLVEALGVSVDPAEIVRELRLTGEGVTYLREGTALDINDLPDPRPAMGKLGIADVNLEPMEILDLLRLISIAMGLRETFHSEPERYPLTREITEPIPNLRALYQRLRGRISPTGEVEDFASPELREARFQISRQRTQIQRSLESILKRAEEDHALRDDFITIRNDRYVIPIRNDNRGAVAGVVHGMSSSGQTAFVEPLETINLNNELVRLRELEQIEITKVLFTITEELRDEREAIAGMAEAAGMIDFIAARARMAIAQNAIEPRVNESGKFSLKDARHPLLEANLKSLGLPIVPISLELDAARRVMVISGPNAGGKTVVLKTAGLLSLMAQAGLHVPAAEAELPIFRQVHADIGDHQSIAANLSTFTAHIQNIRQISDQISGGLRAPALILLDEVGTGTDPEEGSALGVAIVDYFRQQGAHVVATTHYSGLKIYATNRDDVINASVEFDEKTLKPTYRLLAGLAGASSGIEIARRFGLPAAITGQASERVRTASAEAAEYLRRLKEQFDHQAHTLAALEEERAAVAGKYARLEVDFLNREKEREKEFRGELRKVVEDFTARAEQFAASIEDAAGQRRARKDIERRTVELKAAVSTAARDMRAQSPAFAEAGAPAEDPAAEMPETLDFQPGDRVRVLSLGQEGVVESVTGDVIGVQVGALRFREAPENLRLIERRALSGKTAKAAAGLPKGVSISLQEQAATSSELNIIGKTVNEATEKADKFLDAAYLDNFDRVRIVHGIGLGALKRAVADLLSGHPHVAKFYPAPPSEGGNGATIVELKK
ncbi:MAG: endonuclease MutS2 [Blastocatellia bacterium]